MSFPPILPDTNAPPAEVVDTAPVGTPLTDTALARLRKMADGNGLTPDDITLLKTDEKILTLEAELSLRPKCEVVSNRYPGKPRGKKVQILPTLPALHAEVAKLKSAVKDTPDIFIEKALHDVRAHPNEGWGLEDATVTLPDFAVTLAANEPCPQCRGQKNLPCTHCHAQGYVQCPQCRQRPGEEYCYICGGTGRNPTNPEQACIECRGTQWAPCRSCVKMGHRLGTALCPQCHGKRVEPCGGCRATGAICEEITVNYSAETQFRLRSSGLPTVVNRSMDRLGLQNLGKGHADIETYVPNEDEEFELKENRKSDAAPPLIHYRAKLPYAEMKIGVKKKPAVISVFGKRASIVNAPPFLDTALETAREHLELAARGKADIASAMQARAVRDAVMLQLTGRKKLADFRKLYPIGISSDLSKELVENAKLSINRATLMLRSISAAIIIALMGGLMGFVALGAMHHNFENRLARQEMMFGDVGLLLGMELLGWLLFAFGLRFALMRKFPLTQKHALIPKIGKIGTGMLVAIMLIWTAGIYTANPLWLQGIIRFH